MAKGMDVVEKSLEDLEREITCDICYEHYTEPKVLPCLHYYCKKCILKLSLRTGTGKPFSCPECRKEATLPEGNIDNLQTAFFVNRLKETHATLERVHGKVEVKCEMCSTTEAKTEAFCRQCAEFICHECVASHQKMKVFKEHNVVTLDELQEGKVKPIVLNEPPVQKCLTHEESLVLYCFDCAQLICHYCTTKDHKDHDFEFSKIAAPKTIMELREKLNPLREVKISLSRAVEKIQTTKLELKAQGDSVANSIKTSFVELHQILETCQQQLLDKAEKTVKEQMDNLMEQEENVSITNAEVQSVIDYTEQCVSHCGDNEVMYVHAEIRRQIEQKIKEHDQSGQSLDPMEEVDIGVEVNCADALQQICQTKVKITQIALDPLVSFRESIKTAEINKTSNVVMKISLPKAKPIKRDLAVSCHMKSLVDDCIVKCNIKQVTRDEFCIQYTPTVRGRHELTVSVDGQQVTGSPFPVLVSISSPQVIEPVRVWYGL